MYHQRRDTGIAFEYFAQTNSLFFLRSKCVYTLVERASRVEHGLENSGKIQKIWGRINLEAQIRCPTIHSIRRKNFRGSRSAFLGGCASHIGGQYPRHHPVQYHTNSECSGPFTFN